MDKEDQKIERDVGRKSLFKEIKKFIRMLKCRHSHTFSYNLENAIWYSDGVKKGIHSYLILKGCYICGKIWVEDYAA